MASVVAVVGGDGMPGLPNRRTVSLEALCNYWESRTCSWSI